MIDLTKIRPMVVCSTDSKPHLQRIDCGISWEESQKLPVCRYLSCKEVMVGDKPFDHWVTDHKATAISKS